MSRLWEVILMHLTMQSMNNEDAYCEWIYEMPDCPHFDDFCYFAYDEENFNRLKKYFTNVFETYFDDGLYDPVEDVVNYVKTFCDNIKIYR